MSEVLCKNVNLHFKSGTSQVNSKIQKNYQEENQQFHQEKWLENVV